MTETQRKLCVFVAIPWKGGGGSEHEGKMEATELASGYDSDAHVAFSLKLITSQLFIQSIGHAVTFMVLQIPCGCCDVKHVSIHVLCLSLLLLCLNIR